MDKMSGIIPYFSIIDTPIKIIILCLVLALATAMSFLCHMFCMERVPTKLETVLLIVVPAVAIMFLVWLLIGDSTEWSRPIGLWLRGK